MDKIQAYRQPMVTATGLLLGFALNVAANWAPKAFESNRLAEAIVGIGICVHIPLFMIVMYRILNMDYPREQAEAYYKKTLAFLLAGMVVFFVTIVIIMVESFFLHKA